MKCIKNFDIRKLSNKGLILFMSLIWMNTWSFLMISIILTSYTRHFPEAWMSEKMDEAYQTNIGFFTTTNDSKLAVWIATVHFFIPLPNSIPMSFRRRKYVLFLWKLQIDSLRKNKSFLFFWIEIDNWRHKWSY